VVFLAVNPRVWVVLGVLFLLALARRLWRRWRQRRRTAQGSKRP
jgi:membrane protein DedA with SNARE-associated domain